MSYRVQRFEVPISGSAGSKLSTDINEFFALNNFISVIGITTNWRSGRGRADTLYVNLWYRIGGARQYAYRFTATTQQQVQQDIENYFSLNTGFDIIAATSLVEPDDPSNRGDILIILQSKLDYIRGCRPGVYPDYAPAGGNVAVGAFGTFVKLDNTAAPPVTAMNVGNVIWQQGRPGILFVNVDGCPDGAGCKIGGIPQCCGPVDVVATKSITYYEDCGCASGDDSSTTPPVTTATSSTTEPPPYTTTTTAPP